MNTHRLPANVAVAAAITAVDDAGAPLQRIKLLPMGKIVLRDGRGPFHIADRAAADRIVAATAAYYGKTDIPIDYNHALVYAAPQGGAAPAAGWASKLEAADDGIYADVTWTAAASAALAAREYRYVSPVFTFDKANNVLAVHSAGILNIAAITDLPAIAASATLETDSMKKFAAALGLADDADEAAILAAIAAMKTDEMGEVAAAAKLFGLADGATISMVAAAAIAAKPDPAKFVPIAALDELSGQLGKINGERADVAVAAAMTAGKITPALKDWAVAYFKRDEVAFADWLGKAPVVMVAGALVPGAAPAFDGTAATLTPGELAVCAAIGVTAEEFAAAKPKEA